MSTLWLPRGPLPGLLVPPFSTGGSNTTFNLNSAYTYGSAGAAVMQVFTAMTTGNLTDFWFRVDSYQGTWGSTDQNIQWEIREGLAASRIPQSGAPLASGNINLSASPTGWIAVTGLSVALTAGKFYCLVLSDSDGHATNHVRLRIGVGQFTTSNQTVAGTLNTTTNGWSTTGSTSIGPMFLALRIGGNLQGCAVPVDAVATVGSNTNSVGLRFRPPEKCTLVGAWVGVDYSILYSASHVLKLFADATAPGGSPLTSFTTPTETFAGTADFPNAIIFPASDWFDLDAATWYRFVLDPAAATTVPRTGTAGGSPPSEVIQSCFPMNGDCYWTVENAGAWSDQTTTLGLFGMILMPTTSAGGGGGGVSPLGAGMHPIGQGIAA